MRLLRIAAKSFRVSLSEAEQDQLGTSKNSEYNYVPAEHWESMRDFMLQRSLGRNKKLNPDLTAYTPGETLDLLQHPEIHDWHKSIVNFKIPSQYKIVCLVPCAATKPWDRASVGKSKNYKSYHEVLDLSKQGKIPPVYFVTISEPLGVVPQDRWSNFPQYDNPGLFMDDMMRSGLLTRDWGKTPLKKKHIIPFDRDAYDQAIKEISETISLFLNNNNIPGRKFLSFVEDFSGKSTHSDMLDHAIKASGVDISRFTKQESPGRDVTPKNLIVEKIIEASSGSKKGKI